MARRPAFAAILLASLLSSACSAQPPARVTGNAEIDAFLEKIAQKRRDEAIRSIASMESLIGLPNAAETPAQFVDKLMTCKLAGSEQVARLKMFKVRWDCPDGRYLSVLDPDWRAPLITVGQFQTQETFDSLAREAPRPPAPPAPPSSPRPQ